VVGGQDDHAGEGLHPLQQVVDLEVGVAIVTRLDLGALGEQRVGLVEQEDRVAGLGGVEQLGQVLLGLADPLRHDLRQIDLVEVELQLLGDQAGDHGLAGAGRPGEQRRQAEALGDLAAEAPALVDQAPVADAGDELADLEHRVVGQDQVVPGLTPGDAHAQGRQLGVEHAAQTLVEIGRDQRRDRGRSCCAPWPWPRRRRAAALITPGVMK
jgi:hypothetical protein